jgi:CDP-diacylglycerol--glycerol-3-phosphate 3-phosphatidyltransferase
MKSKLSSLKITIKDNYSFLKSGTNKMFKELSNSNTNKKQIANILTFSRLITPLITLITSIIAIITGLYPLFIISGIIAGLGAITDALDGHISRITKSTSEYGKLLDQISDKVFVGIIGINLLFFNINYILSIVGEIIISVVNIYYKSKYPTLKINSTLIGKIKETPLFLSLALGYLSPINSTFMTISNISILVAFIFQIATIESYIISNNLKI